MMLLFLRQGRVRSRGFAWLLVGLALGCSKPKDATPEGAVRELMLVTRAGDTARAYALLAPQSQRRLEKLARLATAQTGGQRTIAPLELLAVGLDPVRRRLGRIEIVESQADHARVRLLARDGKAQEELTLVRVKEGWRVVLPEGAFTAADAPASAPASAPVESAE